MSGDRVRCLIVDDEPLAVEAIRSLAALEPALEVIGDAADGQAALQVIEACRPDLLFLDVEMQEMGGFEMLADLAARRVALPVTIFVTAYDSYALRAFEARALDYLLKPIGEARFLEAVAAARQRIAADREWDRAERHGTPRRAVRRLPVRCEGRISLVPMDEVEWIESEGNYVLLHRAGQSHRVRETMNGIEARLDPDRFMRIHRSIIVNIECIQDLRPWFTGEYIVSLKSGKELTLTRTYRGNLRRLMGDSVE
ncbi:MAG: LytR/AlgR family response regulator transcription factor [Candidatus Polarisedimenticolia bacterium]